MRLQGLNALRSSARDVKLVLASSFFLGFGFAGFLLILNLYLKQLGFGEGIIGSFISYRNWATMVMVIPAAFLIRRLPLKPMMITSVTLATAGGVMVVVFPQTAYIAVGMIITGLASSMPQVIGGPMIMRGSSLQHRPFLFSMNFALRLLSGVPGFLLAGALPDILRSYDYPLITGYRVSLLVSVGITALAIVPFLFVRTSRIADSRGRRFFHVRTPWSRIARLAFPHIVVGLGAGLTIPFLNLYFRDNFGIIPTQLGWLFALQQGLMVGGTLLAPYLAARWGRIKTVIICQMVSVPFLFILSISVDVWLSAAAFLVRAALMNMAQPLVTNFSLEMTHEDDHPLMSGIMTVAWLASWGISANLGGWIIENYGYFLPFNLTLAAYVASSAMYLFLLMPLEKEHLTS